MGAIQYVAFLRAINVGGRVVKMSELKKVFEQLDLDAVSTFIASGNVIFSSPKAVNALHAEVEAALQKALGYPVVTMLRHTGDVVRVAEYTPFAPDELSRASLYVGFMRAKAGPAGVKKALALQTEIDALHVHGREIYWLARKNIAESTITGVAIEKSLQTPVTFRNINTVRRLAAKYGT